MTELGPPQVHLPSTSRAQRAERESASMHMAPKIGRSSRPAPGRSATSPKRDRRQPVQAPASAALAGTGIGFRRLVADLKLTSSLASNSKGKDGEGEIRLGWKGAYVRFGNTETGLLKLVKGRGKWSPSGATAAAVAGAARRRGGVDIARKSFPLRKRI